MVTKTEFGLIKPSPDDFYDVEVQNTNMDTIDSWLDDIYSTIGDTNGDITKHKNASNPHNITPSKIGVNNVNNTSDMAKPVSTAQEAAIAKAKEEANATALNYVQNSMTGHRNENTHVTSAERASWNAAVNSINNATEIVTNGGFEHLQDFIINLPASNEINRNWTIPIPIDAVKKATAIKLVIKGRFNGEVTWDTTGSVGKIMLGTSEVEDAFYSQQISLTQLGVFSTEEFEISQEFTITKQLMGNDTKLIAQNLSNPPLRASYAYPSGFGNAYNVRTGASTDYGVCDFRMRLRVMGADRFSVSMDGTIQIFIR
jgi:hypothetical protein